MQNAEVDKQNIFSLFNWLLCYDDGGDEVNSTVLYVIIRSYHFIDYWKDEFILQLNLQIHQCWLNCSFIHSLILLKVFFNWIWLIISTHTYQNSQHHVGILFL